MVKTSSLRKAFLLILLACGCAQASNAASISFETREKPRKIKVCAFDNGKLKLDFRTDVFWTIGNISWEGKPIGQSSGGTGTVITWDGKPVGTVHRDAGSSEILISVDLTVDGKTIAVVADGKETGALNSKIEGNQFVLIKKSQIGPLLHEARFTLSGTSPKIEICHRYEVAEEITPERFKGYHYVFMHMMPITMTEWISRETDGNTISGSLAGLDFKKDRAVWTRSIRGLACYSPTEAVGVTYLFPQNYPGPSHLVYRPSKDVKFRAILFDRDAYAVGEKLEWSLDIIPFSADPSSWQAAALNTLGL